ncbi:hypothetical protein M5K25_023906 [Dendrobium thyrsiflorum]|uniref:Uncharacterized protein n=1 Tax=Dendrobium thyrsiflorum TaxID=117978 RepID=A0ABD0U0K1_DENTH
MKKKVEYGEEEKSPSPVTGSFSSSFSEGSNRSGTKLICVVYGEAIHIYIVQTEHRETERKRRMTGAPVSCMCYVLCGRS